MAVQNPVNPQYAPGPQGYSPFTQPAPAPQIGYGQQPPAPEQQKPRKRRKWPWILGVLAALIAIVVATSSGGDDADSSATASAAGGGTDTAAAQQDDSVGLNTPVRDGKFEFVVTQVQTGVTSVGDNPYLTEQPQGHYVIVSMKVSNIGDQPQSFSSMDQKLQDTDGRTFQPDTGAQLSMDMSLQSSYSDINPGNGVDVKLVYDMPQNATPASIDLHDSMFSNGVTVALD
ncbi:DUF4352 domain-containing protein [Gordonia sp. CPCC 206044]|uniref:DUF4352 domain-containing protein n=1 Tax=Gordonia sp. CPCC 206044 TaxID=3140793 RepID=UPI003AF35D16